MSNILTNINGTNQFTTTQDFVFAKNRIIWIDEEITSVLAKEVINDLVYLDSLSNDPIKIIISSPGGSVSAGLAIYDVMKAVKSTIYTVGAGTVASMGAFLLSSGDKRFLSNNSHVMIHQISSAAAGKYSDMAASFDHYMQINNLMISLLAKNTGKSYDTIKNDIERDRWFTAAEAVKYGLADSVFENMEVLYE